MIRTIAAVATATIIGLTAGAASTSFADTHHQKRDIPVWVVKPCATNHGVNCRIEGSHPHSIRQLPGSAHMVCVFYAQPAYAKSHDYCA